MDELNFEIAEEPTSSGTRIKVIGLGGAGCNAVGRMVEEGVKGVEFHALNTDRQALNASRVPNRVVIGGKLTRGLGAGADPEVGRQAAFEDTDRIIEILEGADMVFVTCGLGGGTGTGATPVVAGLAREMSALTVAVVTKPFAFEGTQRAKIAEAGLAELAATVDTIITVPNERLLALVPKGTSLLQAYQTADDVLRQAVQGISEIITTPGLVNRDFADIRAIMAGMGHAVMGIATADGENAATDAAKAALNSALMEQQNIEGAAAVLVNITGSSTLSLHDVNAACDFIGKATKNDDVRVNFGIVIDESLGGKAKVTVLATGFGRGGVATQRTSRSVGQDAVMMPAVAIPGPAASIPVVEPSSPFSTPLAAEAPESFESFLVGEAEPETFDRLASAVPSAIPVTLASPVTPAVEDPFPEPMPDSTDLDTPAFLRRERRPFTLG